MTRPKNASTIEQNTTVAWDAWVTRLDRLGAQNLSHPNIVKHVEKILATMPLDINKGWWAQSITVAYEQQIGRRQEGQRADGSYEVSVSKTFHAPAAKVMEKWDTAIRKQSDFNGLTLRGEPRLHETDKWLNWRADLSNGTKLVVGIQKTNEPKAMLGLAHSKLQSAEAKETWRTYWKEFTQSI